MNTKFTWALIGASDIAATRMIPAVRRHGDFIGIVISGSEEHGRHFAASNGIPRSSTTLEDAFSSDIDAVYISNKNDFHYDHALKAIRAGRHVLCEKPVALSLDEAQELVDAAAIAGCTFAVNHHLPGSGLHSTVRNLVADGVIGCILSARISHAVILPERLRGWRINDVTGAGVVLDITCHDASVLNPLLGTPIRVAAVGVHQGSWNSSTVVDCVMTAIEYEGPAGEKIIAQTHDAFTVGYSPTSLEVQGTEGSITVIDAMSQDPDGKIFVCDQHGKREIIADTSHDLYSINIDRFHQAVNGTGTPTASGTDGVNALAVALAADASVRTGTTIPIRLPQKV